MHYGWHSSDVEGYAPEQHYWTMQWKVEITFSADKQSSTKKFLSFDKIQKRKWQAAKIFKNIYAIWIWSPNYHQKHVI
jgi:hypothetical protein